MIYGVDVSAYQPTFDFAACRREGFDFAFVKSTEGTSWRSPNFGHQVRDARAAGLLVAAYHYVRGSDVPGQLANIRSMVSTDVPVILDVEEGAGSIASIRALNKALNDAGYRTPLIYIPKWYWQGHMGSPDLTGLPPNWLSWYPDNTVRSKEAGIALVPAHVWNAFGGLPIAVVQFTSSLAVANYPQGRIDGNAYRGTRDQLAALLTGGDEYMALENEIVSIHKAIYEKGGDQGDQSIIERLVECQQNGRALKAEVAELKATVERVATGNVDYDLLASKVADHLAKRMES